MTQKLEQEVAVLRVNKGWGAARIQAHLKNREHTLGEPLPSTSAISRKLAKVDAMSPAEKLRFTEVRWPESFGTNDLPWESAAAVLELARSLGHPPMVPLAVWYWRATLALPGTGAEMVDQRCRLAAYAAMGESQPNRAEVFASIHTALMAGSIPPGVHHSTGDTPAATSFLMEVTADELARRTRKGEGQ